MAGKPLTVHRQLSCMVHPDLITQVDAYADARGLTRTAAVVILLDHGLDHVRGIVRPTLFDAPQEQQ